MARLARHFSTAQSLDEEALPQRLFEDASDLAGAFKGFSDVTESNQAFSDHHKWLGLLPTRPW